jgi:hypothetical protein
MVAGGPDSKPLKNKSLASSLPPRDFPSRSFILDLIVVCSNLLKGLIVVEAINFF